MKRLDVKEAVARVKSVLPDQRPVHHHGACIDGLALPYVYDCVKNEPVGYGYIRRFEEKLRELTGAKQALAVSSGTAALHLSLLTAGVGKGDEVLCPALTYAASANAIAYCGATPNFIDGALNLNPYKLRCYLARETEKTGKGRVNKKTGQPVKALMVVHLLGVPADMPKIEELANDFALTIVEDAAEALGSKLDGKNCGSFGMSSAISFNTNKIVTTGGGGAFLTNDAWIAAKAFQLATAAKRPHKWLVENDCLAFNYRMPNMCAALGLSQLLELEQFIERKQALYQKYSAAFDGLPGLKLLHYPEGANYWLIAVKVDHKEDRDLFLQALHDDKIEARAIFTPLHKLPAYKDCPQDSMGYAEDTFDRMVCLPSSPGLLWTY